MKRVISARDVRHLLEQGGGPASIPADALLTPAARDILRGHELSGATPGRPTGGTLRRQQRNSGPTSFERLFHSPEIEQFKAEICDIGRRLWQRGYVDGNGGNITMRVDDDLVLCTPTLVSKGYMKPDDLCLIDMEGNQKHGAKKRTSEALMHLAIMKAQPKARACVHAHPPYATGFAVAGVSPPNRMIPEVEVFVGEVPVAPYDTPGTNQMAAHVAELADTHNTILMANHGVVCWGKSVEDAYFKMEIIETYCRTVLVASQLGKGPNTFNDTQLHQLLQLKKGLDIPDRRIGLKEAELRDSDDWRPGVMCPAPPAAPRGPTPDPEAEALVAQVTDIIMERLGS